MLMMYIELVALKYTYKTYKVCIENLHIMYEKEVQNLAA